MPRVHIIINSLIILLCFATGSVFRERKNVSYGIIGISILIALLGYYLPSRPDLLTALFPFSGVIFYSNFYPFAAALFLPIAVHLGKTRFHKIRIAVLSIILLGVTLLPYRYFLLPPAQPHRNFVDENGICRQSSIDTCSAAAMVTLLRLHGIDATESEVAKLALTKLDQGTWTLGQYRALKILAERGGDSFKVRVKKISAEKLLNLNHPAIITAGLRKKPVTDEEKELQQRYQWSPGVMHDVVFLGIDEGNREKVKIGEPDFGLERWWIRELRILFQRYAIFVEKQ